MLVPLNTPIASIVPVKRQVIWAGSRIEISRASATELAVTRTLLSAVQPSWSLTVNATGGDPDLTAAGHAVMVAGDRYLLLKTVASPRRTADMHSHMLHHIAGDGRLLWSLPLRTLDQVGPLGFRLPRLPAPRRTADRPEYPIAARQPLG